MQTPGFNHHHQQQLEIYTQNTKCPEPREERHHLGSMGQKYPQT
jgi:hypothetical protein